MIEDGLRASRPESLDQVQSGRLAILKLTVDSEADVG
jgi:hypothetical protein